MYPAKNPVVWPKIFGPLTYFKVLKVEANSEIHTMAEFTAGQQCLGQKLHQQ